MKHLLHQLHGDQRGEHRRRGHSHRHSTRPPSLRLVQAGTASTGASTGWGSCKGPRGAEGCPPVPHCRLWRWHLGLCSGTCVHAITVLVVPAGCSVRPSLCVLTLETAAAVSWIVCRQKSDVFVVVSVSH